MKLATLLSLVCLLATAQSQAAALDGMPCRKEVWKGAFVYAVKGVPLETLAVSDFRVNQVSYSKVPGFDFQVQIGIFDRAARDEMVYPVEVKITNHRTCEIRTVIAD